MPSFTLTRRQALIAAALALAVVFAAAHFLGRSGSGSGSVASSGASSYSADASGGDAPALSTPTGTAEQNDPAGTAAGGGTAPSAVVVDVAGAVRRPGVYRLSQGSRITDAISRAGGTTAHAETAAVDLAAPLADGEQVLVPSAVAGGSAAVAPDGSSAPGTPTAPVDLNTATAAQLDALPGVGPVTAQKIVDYRQQHGPFTSVDDLDAISGIGAAKIDNLRGLVIA